MYLRMLALAALCASLMAFSAVAQDRANIEKGKLATALVDLDNGDRVGSAFCISASGLFVTNAHVVEDTGPDTSITLVIDAGLKSQRKVVATVVRTDEKCDLAILKAKVPGDYPRLAFADSDSAFETMSVTAFGFPFGKGLTLEEGNYPTVSVNVGRVTALRREKGELQLLQVDVTLNPGNSGGAALNDKGEVVGVVSFGVAGSGVNFLIPVEKLKAMLNKPMIDAQIPEFTADNLHVPKKVEVKLTSLQEDVPEPTVEFWLKKGGGKPVSYALMPAEANRFSGLIAMSKEEGAVETRLRCKVEFPMGLIEGTLTNSPFQMDGKTFNLTEVSGFEFKDGKAVAAFADQFEKKGVVTGLEQVKIDVGGHSLTVDLSKASKVELETTSQTSETVEYIIIVKSKGKEIHRITSTRGEGNAPAEAESDSRGPTLARSPMGSLRPYDGEKKKLPVPGTITDVIQAGGGQYLALVLKQQKKIAIFDAGKQSIVKILPLSTDDVLVAGTLKHLVIVDRTRDVIERWSLDGFKRQTAVKPPFQGVIKSITAGYASDGPLLVHRSVGTDQLSQANFAVLDLMKLKEIPMQAQQTGHYSSFRDLVHVRGAACGNLFSMWCTSHSPQGLQTMIVTEKELLTKYEHDSAGHVSPSPDGMHVFTGFKGVMTSGLKALQATNQQQNVPCVPTSHPRFYLSIPAEPGAQNNLGPEPYKGIQPGIHEIGTSAPLLNLPALDLGENKENASWTANDFTLDKRVYYIMPLGLLLSIPFENTSIVMQSFDFRGELKKADIDYFFISSVPNRLFHLGKNYTYQIGVESKDKGIKFELSSGPTGMKVSSSGKLTWSVPPKFDQDSVDVIVSVTNGAEQQTYDTFTIYRVK